MTRLKIRAVRRLFARHRVLVYAEAIFFWLLAVAAFYWMVGYFIVPSIAESRIERLCGGSVTIHSGHFKGLDGVYLTGVVLGTDADDLLDTPFLRADTIEIQFNPWHLMRGRFTVSSVTLRDFLVTADYDPEQKHWNFTDFSPKPAESSKRANIPLILLDRGAVRIRTAAEQGYREVTTITANGTIAEKTAKNEYGFTLETDGRFGYGPSRFQGGLRLGEKDTKNLFWLAGNVQTPKSGVLQNQWNLHDVKLECTFDDESVTLETCRFSLGQGRGSVTGHLHLHDQRGIALDVNLHRFELAEYLTPDALVYIELQNYLDPGLKDFLSRYHPTGFADIEMTINGTLRDLATADLQGKIHCRDISICDNTFPYRIDHLKGDIEFSGRSLRLAELTGLHDEVQIKIDGAVENFGPDASIVMNMTSPNMRLDADLYRAIADPRRDPNGTDAKMWHEISPSGVTEFDYHFQQQPDGQKSQNVTLRLINASAVYKEFQYPLQRLTGTVIIEDEKIQLKQIVSKYDNTSEITIDGEIFNPKGSDRNYHITCRGRRIPIDRTLIEAFEPDQRSMFDRISIDAMTDFEVDIFPDPTENLRPDFIARVEFQGQTLEIKDFPLPMTDIDASAIITRDLVRINRFESNTESGHIHLNESKLWPQGADPNRPAYSLLLDVNNFQLNDAFWRAAGPDADRAMGKLRLGGAVDANGLLEVNLGNIHEGQTNLTIVCKNNPLRWDTEPLGRIDGTLTIKGEDVIFQDFILHDLPLESFPQELMNPKARTVHAELAPRGTVTLGISRGLVRMGPEGPLSVDVDASLQTSSLLLGQTDPPNRLDGMCEGHYAIDVESGRWRTEARYQIDRFYYQNWQITDAAGDLTHDPNTRLLQSRDFTGRFYEGDVTGNLEMNLGDQPGYKLQLNYSAINLAKLPPLGDTKVQLPSATAGTADGGVVLTGPLDALSQPRGKFSAAIKNLEMGRQSLLGKILTAVQFRRPEEYVFHGIDLNAEVLGPELIFDRIRIIGSPLVFDGQGTVNLRTREMTIELSVWDRIVSDRESIFDMIARGIGSALWKVQIQGRVDDPKVDAVYLSILKQPLDIFKDKTEPSQ